MKCGARSRAAARPASEVAPTAVQNGPSHPAHPSGIEFVDRHGDASAPLQCAKESAPSAPDPRGSSGASQLPAQLVAGVESLSGINLSGVRVHRGSDRPAAVHAHAFAQGNEIHLGPGADRHLPHEAWHIVQQRQGRVRPTTQLQGIAINDDPSLEREAETMGARARTAGRSHVDTGGADTTQAQADSRASSDSPCIQRAIGLEFEVKDWHVRHISNKTKLTKGTEPIVRQDGVELTADDDGDRSDIEWVTGPLESRDELLYVIDQARDLALAMNKAKGKTTPEKATIPASDFEDFGPAHPNAEFLPGDSMNATMQATLGVPLERISALYQALSTVEGQTSVKATTLLGRAGRAGLMEVKGVENTVSKPPIPVDAMSEALKGFLLLVIDYLRTGYSGDSSSPRRPHEQFPKGNLNLLVKTSFTKMLSLVPEKDFLVEKVAEEVLLSDKWVEWIVEAAIPETAPENVGAKKGRRVLDYEYGITNVTEGVDEKPYFIDVSREEWLKNLPKEDALRHDNPSNKVTFQDNSTPLPLKDKLEGFAALGSKTDKEVTRISEEMAAKLYLDLSSSGSQSDPMEKGKGKMEESSTPTEEGSSSRKHHEALGSGEAPVMELRHLSSTGGDPKSWPTNALAAWDIYEKAIGDSVYRAGNYRELDYYLEGYSDRRPLQTDPNLTVDDTVTPLPTPTPGPVTKSGFLTSLWKTLRRKD